MIKYNFNKIKIKYVYHEAKNYEMLKYYATKNLNFQKFYAKQKIKKVNIAIIFGKMFI